MQHKITDILDGVYASFAMATLSECHALPLIRRDHEKALRHTIIDALALVIAKAPEGSIILKSITDEYIDIALAPWVEPVTGQMLFRKCLNQTICHIVACAASYPDLFPLRTEILAGFQQKYSIRNMIGYDTEKQ